MKKRNKNKLNNKNSSRIIGILLIISSIIFYGLIVCINILPSKYLILFTTLYFMVIFFNALALINKKFKKWIKIISLIISAMAILINTIVSIYIFKTFIFMNKINNTDKYTIEKYYVITQKESKYISIKDTYDSKIYVYNEENKIYNEALNKLSIKTSAAINEEESVHYLAESLLVGKMDFIFISAFHLNTIEEEMENFSEKIKVIYTIEIKVKNSEQKKSTKEIKNGPFNIYISGIDTYGDISTRSRSDVNMVISVNPKTNTVLLTSIPRDYYVQLNATNGTKDKLTHAGLYGVDSSIKTIEDLLSIDIDYYLKVNFNTLVNIVDLIGGIEVYSDKAFYPNADTSIYIPQGNVKMDGRTALAFSRERYAYAEGDRHRVQNQQDVISAIIKKMTSSTALLTKYTQLLDSLTNTFETNINMNQISNLIKLQLDKMPSWEILKYSLNGYDSSNYTYTFGKQLLYVMEPDYLTVENATNYIENIKNGTSFEIDVKINYYNYSQPANYNYNNQIKDNTIMEETPEEENTAEPSEPVENPNNNIETTIPDELKQEEIEENIE